MKKLLTLEFAIGYNLATGITFIVCNNLGGLLNLFFGLLLLIFFWHKNKKPNQEISPFDSNTQNEIKSHINGVLLGINMVQNYYVSQQLSKEKFEEAKEYYSKLLQKFKDEEK